MVYPWGETPWVPTPVREGLLGSFWRDNMVDGLPRASSTQLKLIQGAGTKEVWLNKKRLHDLQKDKVEKRLGLKWSILGREHFLPCLAHRKGAGRAR